MFVREETLLIVTINKNWLLQIPPLPLVAVVYAAGLVLLLGGKRLLKAAWFPVLFMWAVIPVPQTFSGMVDLPLQHASATVARAFAHALGQQLTQDKLRLMFTPEFGMFIAPGCNGIRGAITLGLAAIIVGYVYRFRWFVFAPVVAGAVLLGYLFNFLRLCLLVVYYKIALPYPWLQQRAKMGDYIIGACLFVCALAIFFAVAEKLRRDPKDVNPAPPDEEPAEPRRTKPYLLRVAAGCWRFRRSLRRTFCTAGRPIPRWPLLRRRRCPARSATSTCSVPGRTPCWTALWCTSGASTRRPTPLFRMFRWESLRLWVCTMPRFATLRAAKIPPGTDRLRMSPRPEAFRSARRPITTA